MRIPLHLLALALACVVAACSAQTAHARSRSGLDAAERSVVDAINRVRAAHGLPQLRASGALSRAADRHSRDMAARRFFAHPSSNGRSATARVRAFAHVRRVGETIAYVPASGRGQAESIVGMWMRSAGHRAVLLSRGFRRIGVGRAVGTVSGARVALYTADFSSRR